MSFLILGTTPLDVLSRYTTSSPQLPHTITLAESPLYLHIRSKVLSGLQAVQIKQSGGVVQAVFLKAVTDTLLESLPTDRQ